MQMPFPSINPKVCLSKPFMKKVFYPQLKEKKKEPEIKQEQELEKEENFMNLWAYLRRRYPNIPLEERKFGDLIDLKIQLEGPRRLREWTEDIASVRKH